MSDLAVSGTCEHCGDAQPHAGGDGHCECECHRGVELATELRDLRALVHCIAVARRGDCENVDDRWEDLPAEIDRMWRDLNDAQERSIEARNPGIDMEDVKRIRSGQ